MEENDVVRSLMALAQAVRLRVFRSLLTQERQGRNLIYRADFSRMGGLLAYLSENCCQGQPCEVAPSEPCCGQDRTPC
jgi:hypothetical protein